MVRNSIVETKAAIETMLNLGLAPITTNRVALIELGFTRRHPQAASGYESTLWERSLDHVVGFTIAGRRLAPLTQRAHLAS